MACEARSRRSQVFRFFQDVRGVWKYADRKTAVMYLVGVARTLPAILKTGSLLPADRTMARRTCSFAPLPGAVIVLDGSSFSGAREMYCRRVYFARPGFEVRADDIVIDLGANEGLFTTLAATYGGQVVAVEAQSRYLAAIEANLERNTCRGRVTLELALVGGDTGLLSNAARRRAASHWGEEPARLSIADLIERNGLSQVDLIKVDIEGSEFDAFSGDLAWLDLVQRIVMEVHTEFGDATELAGTLERVGFHVALLDSDSFAPVDAIQGLDGYLFASKGAATDAVRRNELREPGSRP